MNQIRYVAAVASAITMILYLLGGFEVLYVGESTSGTDPGMLGFGLSAGGAFAVATALLLFVERRWVWVAVALLNALVIVGYFGMAGLRQPPFEWPGLAIKAAQLISLAAVLMLTVRGGARATAPSAGLAS